jgi:hypothetical protein
MCQFSFVSTDEIEGLFHVIIEHQSDYMCTLQVLLWVAVAECQCFRQRAVAKYKMTLGKNSKDPLSALGSLIFSLL